MGLFTGPIKAGFYPPRRLERMGLLQERSEEHLLVGIRSLAQFHGDKAVNHFPESLGDEVALAVGAGVAIVSVVGRRW